MSPLTTAELYELTQKITATHGLACHWNPAEKVSEAALRAIVAKASSVRVEDRARHTITEVVKALDKRYDEEE
jgi:hypothetical protein